jgi:hypothetical protein
LQPCGAPTLFAWLISGRQRRESIARSIKFFAAPAGNHQPEAVVAVVLIN